MCFYQILMKPYSRAETHRVRFHSAEDSRYRNMEHCKSNTCDLETHYLVMTGDCPWMNPWCEHDCDTRSASDAPAAHLLREERLQHAILPLRVGVNFGVEVVRNGGGIGNWIFLRTLQYIFN